MVAHLESISGHLLLLTKSTVTFGCVPVLVLHDLTYAGTVPPIIEQDYFCETGSRDRYQPYINSTQKSHSGMDRNVVQQGLAVVSTTLHGSVRNFHNQLEMILSSGYVLIHKHREKTFHLR